MDASGRLEWHYCHEGSSILLHAPGESRAQARTFAICHHLLFTSNSLVGGTLVGQAVRRLCGMGAVRQLSWCSLPASSLLRVTPVCTMCAWRRTRCIAVLRVALRCLRICWAAKRHGRGCAAGACFLEDGRLWLGGGRWSRLGKRGGAHGLPPARLPADCRIVAGVLRRRLTWIGPGLPVHGPGAQRACCEGALGLPLPVALLRGVDCRVGPQAYAVDGMRLVGNRNWTRVGRAGCGVRQGGHAVEADEDGGGSE